MSSEPENDSGPQPAVLAELERYRSWLGVLARLQVSRGSGPSSIRPTSCSRRSWRRCGIGPGSGAGTEAELAAWLRQILAHVCSTRSAASAVPSGAMSAARCPWSRPWPSRRDGSGRCWRPRARPLASAPAATNWSCAWPTPSPGSPPTTPRSSCCAMSRASPHDEVARRMGRGVGAVRMLWVRALARLRQELDLTPDAGS